MQFNLFKLNNYYLITNANSFYKNLQILFSFFEVNFINLLNKYIKKNCYINCIKYFF